MAILELFSSRRKKERGGGPDVFVYDSLPQELRVQAIFIVHDALGQSYSGHGFETPAYRIYAEILDLRETFRQADTAKWESARKGSG